MSQHLVDECPLPYTFFLNFFYQDAVVKIIVVSEVPGLFHVAEILL